MGRGNQRCDVDSQTIAPKGSPGPTSGPGRAIPASYVSHCGHWESLLVRAGHHLWHERRKCFNRRDFMGIKVIEAALDDIWEAKRAYRAAAGDRRVTRTPRMWDRRAT